MTDREHWQEHVDDRFDAIEKRIDELAHQKQDKWPRGTMVGILVTVIGQVILLAFMWGLQTEKLATATDDRYRASEASRDFALRDQRLNSLETDILDNEVTLKELRARIRALESEVGNE